MSPLKQATRPDQDAARHAAIERYMAALQEGDSAAFGDLLTPDAVTRWPQSDERIVGAASCIHVYVNYPGGPPDVKLRRIRGEAAVWVAESTADYGEDRWHIVSVIEFDGDRIAAVTDYFGPTLPAPDWRRQWVEVGSSISLGPVPG